ncbi:MAG: ABC transporter ATP-binding protein/permease [Defluviitaleaceae bacterium]|nr:ABC transporter ATP-binding protein/permease [Defluviitaleaceae bacterium]
MKTKKSQFNMTAAIIFSIIAAIFGVVQAFLFREMGNAADSGNMTVLITAIIWQAALFPINFFSDLIAVRFRLAYTFEMLYIARRERMKFLFGRRLKTPAEDSTKDLSYFTVDIDVLRDKYFRHKALIALRISSIIFSLGAMLWLNPLLALAVLGVMGLLTLVSAPFGKGLNARTKAYSEDSAEYVNIARECLQGQREIIAYDKQEIFMQRHEKVNRRNERARMKAEFYEVLANFVTGYSNFFVTFATIGIGSYFVITNPDFGFGDMMAMFVLVQNVGWPTIQFVEGLNGMRAAKGLYEKAKEKAEQEPSKSNLPNFNNIIEIKGLGLKYDEDAYVVKDLDLSFKKGGKYAVFAPSGYGKTSIARALALEFLEYDGTITVDGQELRDISISDYNKIVRYVRQDPYLFSDTAINNLTFFGERPPQEDLNYALSVTRVSDFLPTEEDLQRQISNTSGLSGGQKQRIVLARALLHKPKVLILDEITSGVDLETACAILADIFKDKDLTVIAITHENDERFQSLFDKIVRLDER